MSIFSIYYLTNWRNLLKPKKISKNIKYLNKTKQICRHFSHDVQEKQKEQFVPLMNLMKQRRIEATKSILVQVQSTQSFRELHSYCTSIGGTVKNMFHYTTGVDPLHFIVVEFAKESDVENVMKETSHVEEGVPIYSQFLWFRAANRKLAKLKQNKNFSLTIEDGTRIIKDDQLRDLLQNCDSISKQMIALHDSTKLNEVGERLRFLTARQIELCLSGMFPNATAYPFGSSVNGFGKMGCDLDLVLRLSENKTNDSSRLIYHCKTGSASERTTSQRHMETLGDIIHLFLPGCAQVRRILQARVPIIKFHQQLTDVECDLSMSNMSGVHMSDFLYLMGSIDHRVRPLVFTIRKWASEVGLTNSSPGRWITNFSLTLLVLAFLQNPGSCTPILPTLSTLINLAGANDKTITEDGIDCTFLRDINKLNFKTTNTESLESLLLEFFVHYSQFDFSSKAVCLNEAVMLTKPDHSAMYIVNPLQRGLNVSKNVSIEEVERFKIQVRNAAWALESQENVKIEPKISWGLLTIFDNKQKFNLNNLFPISSKQRRLMEVSTLFNGEEENEINVVYRNNQVKRQVEKINREKRDKLKVFEQKKQTSNR